MFWFSTATALTIFKDVSLFFKLILRSPERTLSINCSLVKLALISSKLKDVPVISNNSVKPLLAIEDLNVSKSLLVFTGFEAPVAPAGFFWVERSFVFCLLSGSFLGSCGFWVTPQETIVPKLKILKTAVEFKKNFFS